VASVVPDVLFPFDRKLQRGRANLLGAPRPDSCKGKPSMSAQRAAPNFRDRDR
jgi:hypothetical protein